MSACMCEWRGGDVCLQACCGWRGGVCPDVYQHVESVNMSRGMCEGERESMLLCCVVELKVDRQQHHCHGVSLGGQPRPKQ